MGAYKQTLSDLTGYLGIGSLIILGGFLILDGVFGIQLLIEHYAATATWAALVAIPILVTAYLLGVFAISASDLLFAKYFNAVAPLDEIFSKIALIRNEILTDRFVELERNRRLVSGASIPFILLGIGSFFEKRYIPTVEGVAYAGLALSILAAVLCPVLAINQYRNTVRLVEKFESFSIKFEVQRTDKSGH